MTAIVMQTAARLSVVRIKPHPDFPDFDDCYLSKPGYWMDRWSLVERQRMWKDYCDSMMEEAGKYIASGGASNTTDLQKAQIFGWSKKAKENLNRYMTGDDAGIYEIIPIYLVPEANV